MQAVWPRREEHRLILPAGVLLSSQRREPCDIVGRLSQADVLGSGCSALLTNPPFNPTLSHQFSVCLATPPVRGRSQVIPQTRFVEPRNASARFQMLAHTARSR